MDEKANILIVDDAPSKLLAMSAALSELNQNVVTASSGREALRYLLTMEFAVILLDVNMPDIDGFETAALIRQRPSSADVPIIFVTAYGDDTQATRGYSLGAVDYLLTPVVPDALRAKVSVFVELFRKNLEIQAQAEQRVALAEERAARRSAEAANRMKDEFLATLSHELRTPLNSILGWVQLLRMGHRTEEDLANAVEVIERNAKMQAKIIEDLLDVSRIISGKLQLDLRPADVTDVVEAAMAAVEVNAEAQQLAFHRDFSPNAPLLVVDPTRLQQAVWNLLSNAVKFTPRGGSIVVTIRQHPTELEIAVADSGDGISPQFLPYVFERFRQADASTSRRHGGLGIGLAIVRQIVEMHGGRIAVESLGSGRGSTFRIFMPLTRAEQLANAWRNLTPPLPAPIEQQQSLAGVSVLVVDDQEDARQWLSRVLSEYEADVFDAPSAVRALELIAARRPRVLVADIGMPDRDGYDLIREVRALPFGASIVAIALTAYARPQERARALAAGFDMHIAKPVNAKELTGAIAGLLKRDACSLDDRSVVAIPELHGS
ncbi:MAG: response regulator [Pirellulales bacterium]